MTKKEGPKKRPGLFEEHDPKAYIIDPPESKKEKKYSRNMETALAAVERMNKKKLH